MSGIKIPKVLNNRRINTKNLNNNRPTNRGTRPYISIEELGLPFDLNFFKQNVFHSSNSIFDTIAWTTLEDVRKEFFNLKKQIYWTEKLAQEFIDKHKPKNFSDLRKIENGSGLGFWLHQNNLSEKYFELQTKPWDIDSTKSFINKYKCNKLTDLRKYPRGSGLINWIIKNNLTKELFPKEYDIEWNDNSAKEFIKKNKPKNFTDLKNFGLIGTSLQRWIYSEGGGRKRYFQDEKIFWNLKIATKFINEHKPRIASDLKKFKNGSGLLTWLGKNKKTKIFFK